MLGRKTTMWTLVAATAGMLALAGMAQGSSITWTGSADSNWNTTAANWAGGATTFTDGGVDAVTFDNAAGGTIAVAANMTPQSWTVSATSGTYAFSGGPVDGNGALNKSGAGMLLLQSQNTFTGGINMAGGVIRFSNGNQLGSSAATIAVTASSTLDDNDPATGGAVVANPMTMSPGVVMTFTRSGSQPSPTYSGKISGTGDLRFEKIGIAGNSWSVSNSANDFTGSITIFGGTSAATFGSDGAMGNVNNAVALNTGTLSLGAGVTYSATRTLTLQGATQSITGGTVGANVTTWQGQVIGPGTIYMGYALALTNTSNSQTSTYLNCQGAGGAMLTVPDPLCLGSQNSSNTLWGANLQLGPTGLRVTGTGSMTFPQTFNYSACVLDVTNAAGMVNWTGPLNNSGYTNATIKKGPGGLTVTDWNISTAPVDLQGGSFILNDSATPNNMKSWTVENTAALGGNGLIRLNTGESVTVMNGGTLKGTLTINGGNGTTIQNGGAISPGMSAGTLTFGSLALNSGSIINLELNNPSVIGGGVNDLVSVTGQLTLDGIINLTSVMQTGAYTVMQYGSLVNNGIDQVNFPAGLWGDVTVGGGVVVIHALPEPGAIALLGLGLVGLMIRRKR